MSRFWIGVGVVLAVGMLAAFSANGKSSSQIMIHDLETECRGDRDVSTSISIEPDNSLRFEGYFPVENTDADLSFDYNGGSEIILNVRSQEMPSNGFLWHDCLASAVYDLETGSLEEGRYSVEIRHDGKRAEKKILRIN